MKTNRMKRFKKMISLLMAFVLCMSAVPTAAFGATEGNGLIDETGPISEPDPETFKYMNISSANSTRPMSYCYYKDKVAEYYSPFAVNAEEAIISFTIYRKSPKKYMRMAH